jgi:hypothetical protein
VTAIANWTAPRVNGGLPNAGYRVTALQISATGTVLSTAVFDAAANATSLEMVLSPGNYSFTVEARNSLGFGPASARSGNLAIAR